MGSFIHGKRGRMGFTVAASLASLSISAAYALPYLFPNSVMNITISHRLGVRLKVPQEMLDMVDQVTNDIELLNEKKEIIKPYLTDGLSIIHAGRFHSRMFDNKYFLGIPMSYLAKDKEELPSYINKGFAKSINWKSTVGEQLKDNFLLSESAKKFIIAQTICTGEATLQLHNFCFSTVGLLGNVFLCKKLNNKFSLFKRSFLIRFGMYGSLTYLSFLAIYGFVDYFLLDRLSKLDERIVTISPVYADGAIEYYTKLLQRNKVLHQFPECSTMFTEEGNERRRIIGGVNLTDNLKHIQEYINSKKEDPTAPTSKPLASS